MPGERVTVTSKRQVTLPATICRELGIKQGSQFEVVLDQGEIHLLPVARFPELTKSSALFRFAGIGASVGGAGAREHDQILASEAAGQTSAD